TSAPDVEADATNDVAGGIALGSAGAQTFVSSSVSARTGAHANVQAGSSFSQTSQFLPYVRSGSSGGGKGLVSIGDAYALSNIYFSNLDPIGDNAQITAGLGIAVLPTSVPQASAASSADGRGLGVGVDVYAQTTVSRDGVDAGQLQDFGQDFLWHASPTRAEIGTGASLRADSVYLGAQEQDLTTARSAADAAGGVTNPHAAADLAGGPAAPA